MVFDKLVSPWMVTHSLVYRLRSDSLLRNSIYIMCSTIATSAIGYLYWIMAAHIYSVHDVGLASAFLSVMTLTSTFANLGIGSALVQMLPRRKAGYSWSLTLNACIAMGSLASLLGGIIVAIALPLLSPQFSIVKFNAAYTLIFSVGVTLWTIATLLDQTFVAERATSNLAVRNTVFALLKLPLMVLFVQVGALGIFSSWVLALAATVIFAAMVLIPRLKRGYNLALHGIVEQIRPMLSSFVGHHFINLGGMIPMYLLPVFVAVRLSATDNAYFYTTWMLGSLFFMVSPAVAMALFSEGSHSADNIMRKALSSTVIIGMLLGPILLVFLLGGYHIMSLFGPSYAQHGLLLLTILIISAVPDAITNIYVSLLRVQGRLRSAALLNLIMAVLTLALAWILLPMLGIAGAGWAWLIAQTTGSLIAGADIFISHSLQHLNDKDSAREVELNYRVTEGIWLMNTFILPVVLPIVRLPAIEQPNEVLDRNKKSLLQYWGNMHVNRNGYSLKSPLLQEHTQYPDNTYIRGSYVSSKTFKKIHLEKDK